MDGATGAGPGRVEDLSRDVGGHDPAPAGGGLGVVSGGDQAQARRLIETGQERTQAQQRGHEHALRLIEAGQEKARGEKRQQQLEREQARERQRGRDRAEDFELEP